MLDRTLAGIMPKKNPMKPRTMSGAELDKKLQDTLSGLERDARHPARTPRAETPAAPHPQESVPAPQPVAAPPPVKEEEEPPDGTRFGQYVLLEKIATGGMVPRLTRE